MGLSTRLFRYKVPLSPPFKINSTPWREGLYLSLQDDSGTGWGECAPLPGFSKVTLDTCIAVFRQHLSHIDSRADIDVLLSEASLPSEVRFAIEHAAQINSRSAEPSLLTINGLIGPHEPVDLAIRRVAISGFNTVKIKLNASPEEAAERVRTLSTHMGPNVSIKLDANRLYSLEDALRFAELIEKIPITYIEEPVQNPEELTAFYDASKRSLALDETARECSLERCLQIPGVVSIVTKPSLHGGLLACRTLAKIAGDHGLYITYSSAYETPLGLTHIAHMAAESSGHPAGLDTVSIFDDTRIQATFPIRHGQLEWTALQEAGILHALRPYMSPVTL